jgi:hypothetical protein
VAVLLLPPPPPPKHKPSGHIEKCATSGSLDEADGGKERVEGLSGSNINISEEDVGSEEGQES